MKKALALIATTFLGAGAAQGATIVNGSFEDGPSPGAFITLAAGNNSIAGWTVDSGTIDYIGSHWTAQNGSRSIDLAGNSVGTLSQTLSDTIAGQSYEVSFYISKNPDGGATPRTGTFSAGGKNFQFSYGLPNDRTNMNWQRASYRFAATGTSTKISFSADGSAGCCAGPALDNVSIAAVPEPATWAMMIGGFGMVGGAMRLARRRQKAAFATA
jgi:choice-of-anchor C domain-containing protein